MKAMRLEIMSALDQRLAALQGTNSMAMGQAHMPAQAAATQMRMPPQMAAAWPGQGMQGQPYTVWPQGPVVDARHLTQGAAVSTGQPMVLMQMPLAH